MTFCRAIAFDPHRGINTKSFSPDGLFTFDQMNGGAKFEYLMTNEIINNYICENCQIVFNL
jgi:hypothetical protein